MSELLGALLRSFLGNLLWLLSEIQFTFGVVDIRSSLLLGGSLLSRIAKNGASNFVATFGGSLRSELCANKEKHYQMV